MKGKRGKYKSARPNTKKQFIKHNNNSIYS